MPTTDHAPFRFWTRLTLTKLTGRRARDLAELIEHLRTVPGSVIFHHTHHFLVQHQHLSPEPPNDFAFWVTTVLQEEQLGEQLAAIDTVQFASLRGLRDRIIDVIDRYVERRHELRTAPEGEEFHFMDAASFTLPTKHQAATLADFCRELTHVSASSIAYHLFESRLRLDAADNDFSQWFEHELDQPALAAAVRRLDPYTFTTEGLRQRLISLVSARINGRGGAS